MAVSPEMLLLTGRIGEAYSILRPAGKVIIDGRIYDAVADVSWIPKGSKIVVVRQESSQVYVKISE